jgi:hypothetical protein
VIVLARVLLVVSLAAVVWGVWSVRFGDPAVPGQWLPMLAGSMGAPIATGRLGLGLVSTLLVIGAVFVIGTALAELWAWVRPRWLGSRPVGRRQ